MDFHKIATFTLAISLFSVPSIAQRLPDWNIARFCNQDSDRAACIAFGGNAYSQVTGPWLTLSQETRKACLDELARLQQQSYRLLRDCLEDKVLEINRSAQSKRIPE